MIPPVVDSSWVAERRDRLLLADVRWYLDGRSGPQAYENGHLPGAVFVDLEGSLSSTRAGGGRHPLPDPDSFARAMSLLGIGDASSVVGYDDAGGVIAARLVWMLRATGRDAALLDGGMLTHDGPLETGSPPTPAPLPFTPRPWPAEALAGADDASDPANTVIDARSRERYLGEEEPVDARAGHIPGARSLPCREHLDADGRLLPRDALRDRFRAAGVSDGASVVSYCGSGVTACHNLLVLEHCGLGSGRLYPGSWSEYSQLLDLPVETGDRR